VPNDVEKWSREASRVCVFALIGVLNTGIDFATYYALTRFAEWPQVPAHIVGFLLGAFNSYILNGTVTFGDRVMVLSTIRRTSVFAAVTAITVITSSVTLVFLRLWIGDLAAKAVSTLVTFGLGFILNRDFVFPHSRQI
jgi:putative flippase GtrA